MLFLAILAGIGLARTGWHFSGWWCLFELPFLGLATRGRQLLAVIIVALFGLSCGWWRGSIYLDKLSTYAQAPQHSQLTITAVALDDALYGTNQQLAFDASDIHLSDGQELPGKIQLSGFGLNAVFDGDEVEATGQLNPGYGAYAGQMSFAKLTLLAHHRSWVGTTRGKFTAGMQTALPEPLASFAMGLLVGQRATLSPSVKQDLLMVGLTHIIAVSGYNLTIILHAAQRVIGRRSKRLSTFLH